ncbi:RNA-directed DNA polymerase from mobile element jockey-like [Brachionus plicatilis]|uniref:RNA-directed DNA polymerase from mobile element jockey-like n=1 Tax=Brachionus plicatilis TaxID=10195 RepID=A0A3M7QHX3_BRAPC|nr:RNA-directed DNA polymerase from mobile element jockey-like [Brachionus plicatilis]
MMFLFDISILGSSLKIINSLPPYALCDDLCIWFTHKSKRIIKKILQSAINKIVEFCEKWGLTINKSKTCYTVFTSTGLRKNYVDKYSIELKVDNELIPLEPNPTFLGIKLDPKLKYAEHLRESSSGSLHST